MSIKISIKKNLKDKQVKNYVLFCNDDYKIYGLNNLSIKAEKKTLYKSILTNKSKDKKLIFFDINPNQKVILIKIQDKFNQTDIEKIGAQFYDFIRSNLILNSVFFDKNISDFYSKNKYFLDDFFHGVKLKSYQFEKYKSKKKDQVFQILISIKNKLKHFNQNKRYYSLIEGTNYTKDLVSEPGNILNPDEYAKRLKNLKKFGLKVNIYDEKKLKKNGMNALLGVGQGSIRGSYLVTIEWKGLRSSTKPLAFVGKGVCFDTGGISLKPAKFMEDMTYDMAGSAVVVGLMKNLALRKAKINAVGVVGLVENMPGGNAQRPGDIVKSYSGKTIEILNTDAEGRLVLADALTFTESRYKPQFIVDLATLTGAIIVALGSEYAGLFSNNDKLSKELFEAGKKVDEKVWRMPLNKNYDKLIDSKNADMQNINYVGGAGSTTAAQFLQRFILKNTPWAHLDIAGMAFSKYGGALNSWGATGFGVRLLNKLIEDNYE